MAANKLKRNEFLKVAGAGVLAAAGMRLVRIASASEPVGESSTQLGDGN